MVDPYIEARIQAQSVFQLETLCDDALDMLDAVVYLGLSLFQSLLKSLKQMSHLMGKPTMWFPNRSDTNRPVQAQLEISDLSRRGIVLSE